MIEVERLRYEVLVDECDYSEVFLI
ncbi:hypothetical protein Patl1_32016 [Pistacia atlantica]|uniref:Uncharacterized protein n=1 Tax=Pistacia atlantica TaxID=434234 RepID=A0ACC1APN6_9ROSI|nr:hypothetical protein Patl1_32016 [Pistacia atlantica]